MNGDTFSSWQIWALLSAVFAALTAIFAKIGLQGVDSDFATLIRTCVILFVLGFASVSLAQGTTPNLTLTPGLARPLSKATICATKWGRVPLPA